MLLCKCIFCNYPMSPQSILFSAIVYFCPVRQVCLEHFVLATFGSHLSTTLWTEWHAQIRLQTVGSIDEGSSTLPSSDSFCFLSFSGGQRRRVSLGAALLQNPELLILDEPTVGVDPVLRSKYVFLSHAARLTAVHSPWPISFPRSLHKTFLDKRKSQITHKLDFTLDLTPVCPLQVFVLEDYWHLKEVFVFLRCP